ncbi:MAG: hypothetical protein AAFZ38_06065 [Myxococcota bacterium]
MAFGLGLDSRVAFAATRVLLAFGLLDYNLRIIAPRFDQTFGTGSMVTPELVSAYSFSPLFWLWDSPLALRLLFAGYLVALVGLGAGFYARLAHLIALPLAVAFHHANPYVIHEPQQLHNLLLWVLLFVPIEQRWTVRKTPFLESLERGGYNYRRWVALLGSAYVSSYYLFAGLKKLPDPAWLDGRALYLLVHWTPLRLETDVAELLRSSTGLSMAATYLALGFELTFAPLACTRFRFTLPVLGLLFHVAIGFTLDVGHFLTALLPWYPFLMVERKSLVASGSSLDHRRERR